MEYRIENLTKEEAAYIGEKINEIVPCEVDAGEEEFVLKIENESGEIIGGCIAQAYEYHWSRMFLDTLWVDERYRHQGLGSMIIREVERIAREKGCRVVTLGTDGRFIAGVIADADKGAYGFVNALFTEEALRHQGLGTYLLKAAEAFAKENGAAMMITSAGDWNVDFFQKERLFGHRRTQGRSERSQLL